jgi:hypothetical protein
MEILQKLEKNPIIIGGNFKANYLPENCYSPRIVLTIDEDFEYFEIYNKAKNKIKKIWKIDIDSLESCEGEEIGEIVFFLKHEDSNITGILPKGIVK